MIFLSKISRKGYSFVKVNKIKTKIDFFSNFLVADDIKVLGYKNGYCFKYIINTASI